MTTVIEGEDSELGGDYTSGYRRLEHSDKAGRKRGASRLGRVIDWIEAFDARDARPLRFAVSMTAGAAVYISLPFEPPVWVSVVAVVSASVCIWLARPVWRALFLLTLAVMAFGVAAGFMAGKVSASTKAGTPITSVVGPAQLEGWMDGVDPGTKGPRLRIRVHAISGLSEAQTPQYVRLTHRTRLEVGPGRFVRCRAVIRPPPGLLRRPRWGRICSGPMSRRGA